VPAGLSKKDDDKKTELERIREHIANTDPDKDAFEFSAYKSADVKQTLEKLFHGKCAYCESVYASTAPVDIEHYRPKGSVAEEKTHPGYWWLASDWENLLPSCIDCNRRRGQRTPKVFSTLLAFDEESRKFNKSRIVKTGKADSFPIQGTRATAEMTDFVDEQAFLLDPCRDDPSKHIRFNVDSKVPIGLVFPSATADSGGDAGNFPLANIEADQPIRDHADAAAAANLSPRGAVSVHVYGLNRLGLVQERTRILRRLNFLKDLIIELTNAAELLDAEANEKGGQTALIARRLRFLCDRILGEIKEMARDSAPYSAMVREWISAFRTELGDQA
jgi:uncharacterized protein (TIGR02646 family)